MADQINLKPRVVPIYFNPSLGAFITEIDVPDPHRHLYPISRFILFHEYPVRLKAQVAIVFRSFGWWPLFIDCFPTKKAQS